VVVDTGLADRIGGGRCPRPPRSLDLCVRVLSRDQQALDQGEFTLIHLPWASVPQAGAVGGRFSGLLGLPGDMMPAGVPPENEMELEFPPLRPRAGNVVRVPRAPGHPRIVLGCYPEPRDLTVDQLLIGADEDGWQVWARPGGRDSEPVEVTPVVRHLLDPVGQFPNIARFLLEAARSRAGWQPWDWGQVTHQPWTPRVRTGRTVLAPARWRPDPGLLDPSVSWPDWHRALDRFRARWDIPERATAAHGDRHLDLDLTDPLHLRVLRNELRRRPRTVLRETVPPGVEDGWAGGRCAEAVVTLHRRPDPAPPGRRPPPRSASRPLPSPPGGRWLSARLPVPEDRQHELLVHRLPALLSACSGAADRWFFLRYADSVPHLRLRLRSATADPALLHSLFHTWATELTHRRLCGPVSLHTYDPEFERFAGSTGTDLAEQIFHADSDLALARLAVAPSEPDDRIPATARQLLRILSAFAPDLAPGILRSLAPPADGRSGLRSQVPLVSGPEAGPETGLDAALLHRLTLYRSHLDSLGTPQAAVARIAASLLHLHNNRLLGTERAREARCQAIALLASPTVSPARTRLSEPAGAAR
jgi:lantibiotic biosynthesis protein